MNPIALLRSAGFVPSRKFTMSEVSQLTDKIAVITGGQAGIGAEITAQLLLHGIAKVYVLARTEDKFVTARSEWATRPGLSIGDVEQKTEFIQCDLDSIQATAEAAKAVLAKIDRLDLLFNNAGNDIHPKGMKYGQLTVSSPATAKYLRSITRWDRDHLRYELSRSLCSDESVTTND